MADDRDVALLKRALKLARKGRYATSPNPRVGAVVVGPDHQVVGEGFHRRVGEDHAEVVALRAAGGRARGGTLYLNLEPCCHRGRTPPCADAVIAAGVSRVVACHGDPDPRVRGAGFDRLRRAGIEVEVGPLAEEAALLNLPFLVSNLLERPAVTLKWAMSLDGRIATANGESQWISSPAGRRWALDLREEHDAILVGSGTALADDPRLDRRRGKAVGPNLRVVLDRRLRLGAGARMFDRAGEVLIYTESAAGERRRRLEERGATVTVLPRVSPAAVLDDLHVREIRSLLVEGGGEVLAAFAENGAFDAVAVCCAPVLIGGRAAPGPLGGSGATSLAEAVRLDALRARRRGPDVILTGCYRGRLAELLGRIRGDS